MKPYHRLSFAEKRKAQHRPIPAVTCDDCGTAIPESQTESHRARCTALQPSGQSLKARVISANLQGMTLHENARVHGISHGAVWNLIGEAGQRLRRERSNERRAGALRDVPALGIKGAADKYGVHPSTVWRWLKAEQDTGKDR